MVTTAEASKTERDKKTAAKKKKSSTKPIKENSTKPAAELKKKHDKKAKKDPKREKKLTTKSTTKSSTKTKVTPKPAKKISASEKKSKPAKKEKSTTATTTAKAVKKKRSRSFSLSCSSSSSSHCFSPPVLSDVNISNIGFDPLALNTTTLQFSTTTKSSKGAVKGGKASSKGKKSSQLQSPSPPGFGFGFGSGPPGKSLKGKGSKKGFGKSGKRVALPKRVDVSYEMIIEEVKKIDVLLKNEDNNIIHIEEDEFRTALFDACYNNILTELSKDKYQSKYGCNSSDLNHFMITPKSPVPSYFANVSHGSIYERKILSILGLRNLVYYGPKIYNDLQSTLFSSDPEVYNHGSGVSLMKQMTGNAVDLDTCVLRCSDSAVLKMVNSLNSKSGQYQIYNHSDEFGSSIQAREMAVSAARPMLESFCKDMKLTPQQLKQRKVDSDSLTTSSIPMATHNTDRGKFPLWQYVNVGQNSFHANVPCLPDVVGSVLLSPYHLMLCFSIIMTRPEEDRETLLDSFFEDCVVDACFNLKWKAIEEFIISLASFDTISSALAECEKCEQRIFNKIFDNEKTTDDEKNIEEASALWDLLKGKYARDEKTNTTRAITKYVLSLLLF